jgi:hypothetical protein
MPTAITPEISRTMASVEIEAFAQNLGLPDDSLFFVVGFYKENDVRTVKYFGISFSSLDQFRTNGWHDFFCEEVRSGNARG